ncbi:hypothetical protein BU15DRAFT_60667 [Melanogaster broomeanus]|nr:hypothetical protein BU15DRAFT_60667 [Melanogaster broomeanus]
MKCGASLNNAAKNVAEDTRSDVHLRQWTIVFLSTSSESGVTVCPEESTIAGAISIGAAVVVFAVDDEQIPCQRKSRSGRNGYPHPNAEIDIEIQQWAAEPLDAGGNLNKRRGTRSWKNEHPDLELVHCPGVLIDLDEEVRLRQEQVEDGERGGEGRGRGLERPFLKPIKFVRSTFTPFPFQRSEELPEPLSEEVGPDGRACCSGVNGIQRFFPADSELKDENQLEEIDFADPGRIRAEIDAVAAVNKYGASIETRGRYGRDLLCRLGYDDSIEVAPHWRGQRNRTPGAYRALDQSANGIFAEVPDVLIVEEESPSSSSGFVDDPWQHPLRL